RSRAPAASPSAAPKAAGAAGGRACPAGRPAGLVARPCRSVGGGGACAGAGVGAVGLAFGQTGLGLGLGQLGLGLGDVLGGVPAAVALDHGALEVQLGAQQRVADPDRGLVTFAGDQFDAHAVQGLVEVEAVGAGDVLGAGHGHAGLGQGLVVLQGAAVLQGGQVQLAGGADGGGDGLAGAGPVGD